LWRKRYNPPPIAKVERKYCQKLALAIHIFQQQPSYKIGLIAMPSLQSNQPLLISKLTSRYNYCVLASTWTCRKARKYPFSELYLVNNTCSTEKVIGDRKDRLMI
jgi:hypothetical protein